MAYPSYVLITPTVNIHGDMRCVICGYNTQLGHDIRCTQAKASVSHTLLCMRATTATASRYTTLWDHSQIAGSSEYTRGVMRQSLTDKARRLTDGARRLAHGQVALPMYLSEVVDGRVPSLGHVCLTCCGHLGRHSLGCDDVRATVTAHFNNNPIDRIDGIEAEEMVEWLSRDDHVAAGHTFDCAQIT